MKRGVLKITNKTHSAAKTAVFRRNLLNSIFIYFIVSAVCYVLLVGGIIFNIVDRKVSEANYRDLAAQVGALELGYLSAYKDIDVVAAGDLGFVEVPQAFATKATLSAVFEESHNY